MRSMVWIAGLVARCNLPPLAPVGPTLLVSNRGLGQLVLRDRIGRLATLSPGQERCVTLRQMATPQVLIAVTEGRSYETPIFVPDTEAGWRLVVGTAPRSDVVGLVPSEAPCDPHGRQRKGVAS